MKILLMHLKIFLCIAALLIVLGIITVSPCASEQPGSLCGRCYGLDTARCNELLCKIKRLFKKNAAKN